MGCCISKCSTHNNKFQEDDHHECVKDKLVISQSPPISQNIIPSLSTTIIKKSLLPSPSSSSSSSSLSSSTVTSATLSSSLSSSSVSSSLCFKDRSFSNDFLLSCAQDHDHILLDIKRNMSTTSANGKKYPSSSKPASPRRDQCNSSTPKKRPRANSPTMVRQKSFRKEVNNLTSSPCHHFPSTRSPSPSRRFPSTVKGESSFRRSPSTVKGESSFRRSVVANGNNNNNNGGTISRSSSLRRDINNHSMHPATQNHDAKIVRIGSAHVKSSQDYLDSFLLEDINNPLIALDCFIFL